MTHIFVGLKDFFVKIKYTQLKTSQAKKGIQNVFSIIDSEFFFIGNISENNY